MPSERWEWLKSVIERRKARQLGAVVEHVEKRESVSVRPSGGRDSGTSQAPKPSPAQAVQLAEVKKEEPPEVETKSLRDEKREEQRRQLGIPTGKPEYTREGYVVIPQRERVSHEYYASRVGDVETQRGIRRPTETPMLTPIRQAEVSSERRREGLVSDFEEEHQPEAQLFIQRRYNEMMNIRARELGMTYDAGTGTWYGNESQIQSYQEYEPVARQRAMDEGQVYYESIVDRVGLEQRLETVTREEYGERGYILVEKPDGTYEIVSREDYQRQKELERYKEEYRRREKGKPHERVSTLFEFWVSGFTPHDPFWTKTIGEILLGEEEGKAERLQDIRSEASYKWTKGIEEKGFVGALEQTLGAGSPAFTIISAYTGAKVLGFGIGFAGQIAGPTITKGIEVGVGGYFLGRSAADIEQLTRGRITKYGGPLGLIPLGLAKQERKLTKAERFSSLAMMGVSIPFAVSGYRGGLKAGQKYASTFYTPKYFIDPVRSYAYQKIQPKYDKMGRPIQDKFGMLVRGDIVRSETIQRIIFGRRLPFRKTITATGKFEGVIGKKQMTYVDKKGSITWYPGEVRGQLYDVTLTKSVMGVDFVRKIKNVDSVFTAYPSRLLKVDIGKRMGVDIEPIRRTDGLVTIVSKHPGMTLTLTKNLVGRELFKPVVSSKFYPSESVGVVGKSVSYDKAVSQMWELAESKAVMKIPHMEKVKVSFFEYGKPPSIVKDAKGLLGFTILYGPGSQPRIYVREPGGPSPKDVFGREDKRSPTSTIMRHELIHRLAPHLSEYEVQAMEGRRFPSKKMLQKRETVDYYFTHWTSVKELKKFHKNIRPIVNKAVKEFWRTGEIGISVMTGRDVYKITPFRQVISRESPFALITGRVSGMTASLVGLEKAGQSIIGEPLKTRTIERSVMEKTGRQEAVIERPGKPETILKQPPIEVGIIDLNVGELWGRGVDIGVFTGITSKTAKATEVSQRNRLVNTEISMNKLMTGELQRPLTSQVVKSATKTDVMGDTDVMLGRRGIVAQMQTQAQMTESQTKITTIMNTTTVATTVTITPASPVMPFLDDLIQSNNLQEEVYHGYTYKTQFKDGKRIRGREKVRVTKHPYRKSDAAAVVSHKVDNSAKRTIILEKTTGKPHKRPKNVKPWFMQRFEYDMKNENKYVEINRHAIDSPGEIQEITMKGIQARKSRGKRGKSTPSIKSIEKRMMRRMVI